MKQVTTTISELPLSTEPDSSRNHISLNFPPGKFSAPQMDPRMHLLREKVLRPVIRAVRNGASTVCIEARAGQGKSLLAAQFLNHMQARFAWLQVGPEDRSPVMFISALTAAMAKTVPDLVHTRVYQMADNGLMDGKAPDQQAGLLIKALIPLIENDLYVVLDDLHLLTEASTSLVFLKALIKKAPRQMRFILLSRSSIPTGNGKKTVRLDNSDLALSRNDVATLFTETLKIPLSADKVTWLHRHTEGWMMGLILAGHAIANDRFDATALALSDQAPDLQQEQLFAYFHNEIRRALPVSQWRTLLSLSLLEQIPLALAQTLNKADQMDRFLEKMVGNNFFLRRLDEHPPVYAFHHLFRDYLKKQAERELSTRHQRAVLARSGHWFLHHQRPEQALHYYLRARAYGMVEKILGNAGLKLMATRRMNTIKEAIELVPEPVICAHPWLCFSVATVFANLNPPKSKMFLDHALDQFVAQNKGMGELMTLVGLITYHMGVDCDFTRGEPLVLRAEALYRDRVAELPITAKVQSTCGVANGLSFFSGQLAQAVAYTEKVAGIADEYGLDDALAGVFLTRGFAHCFQGNWNALKADIENALLLIQSPRVSGLNKTCLLTLHFHLLAMAGNFQAFKHYKALLNPLIESKLFTMTAFGASIGLLDVATVMAQGRMEDALPAIEKGLLYDGSRSAHMQSSFLAYRAYLYALNGQRDGAVAAAEKSLELRRQAGGAYYTAANDIIIGGTYALTGQSEKADQLLSRAISATTRMGAQWLCAGAYAQRAALYLHMENMPAAIEDIRHWLILMRKNRYQNCFSWHPDLMKKLLSTAEVHGIERDYALKLARERFRLVLTGQGREFPLLEIITLGGFEIRIDGMTRIHSAALTENQRSLLAMLVSAPRFCVALTEIQAAFWSDGQAARIRSKTDNLISRFRKVLNQYLFPLPASEYLMVEKGSVRLQHCWVDAIEFQTAVHTGNSHLKRAELWQAEMAFLQAHHLYQGHFAEGIALKDPTYHFSARLQMDYLESALHRSRLLSAAGRLPEAVAMCQKALATDPTYEPLVKMLHQLLIQRNDPVQAKKVAANYKLALQQEGYSAAEIQTALKGLA